MNVTFLDELLVKEVADDNHELITAFRVLVGDNGTTTLITVPQGFQTNYASVPRVAPLAYALFGNIGNKAATVHDFLYTKPAPYPKDFADSVFRAGLIAQGIEEWKADAMYAAVREFGGADYNTP